MGNAAEVRGPRAAVHERRDREDAPAVLLDDVDCLLDAAAARDDVLRHDHGLAGEDAEAAQNELAVLLLGEDALLVEGARDLVAEAG